MAYTCFTLLSVFIHSFIFFSVYFLKLYFTHLTYLYIFKVWQIHQCFYSEPDELVNQEDSALSL